MLQKYFSCCISSLTWHCILASTKRVTGKSQILFFFFLFLFFFTSLCKCLCLLNNASQLVSVRFFMCGCVLPLWQARRQQRTGCLIGVRLRGVVSCVNSGALWLPHFHGKHLFGGLQVFNTLIYTSKQPRKGIVLKGGEGLQEEGGQGNEGCFIFSPPPPPPLRAGQGFKSMREVHWCHNDRL